MGCYEEVGAGWTARIEHHPPDGAQWGSFRADIRAMNEPLALATAQGYLDRYAKGKRALIRNRPEATTETDFATNERCHKGYVRFHYRDEPGEWEDHSAIDRTTEIRYLALPPPNPPLTPLPCDMKETPEIVARNVMADSERMASAPYWTLAEAARWLGDKSKHMVEMPTGLRRAEVKPWPAGVCPQHPTETRFHPGTGETRSCDHQGCLWEYANGMCRPDPEHDWQEVRKGDGPATEAQREATRAWFLKPPPPPLEAQGICDIHGDRQPLSNLGRREDGLLVCKDEALTAYEVHDISCACDRCRGPGNAGVDDPFSLTRPEWRGK